MSGEITRGVARRVYRAMAALRVMHTSKWANGERVNIATGYYMMNVGHPFVADAYQKWLHANGISAQWGKSDEVRTQFELSMLSNEACAMLGDFIRASEQNTVDFKKEG